MTVTEKEDMVRAIALAVAPLTADRDQISLQLDLAKADRDKWFNTARAELALRQTAEAYAARNALRVIAVEGEMENWRQIGLSNAARIEGLETSLRAALEAHESGNKYACGRILKTAASAPETSEVVK